MSDIDTAESCEACGSGSVQRQIASSAFERSSVFEPYFEPALGCKIVSKSQKAQVLKRKGLIEVGNESPESMYRNLEVPREKRIAARWDNI